VKALVTGAAGFVGSHLCERLVSDGAEVLGVDRLSDYYDPELKLRNLAGLAGEERFRFVEGDLNELDLGSLMAGVESVFHLAAQPGVRASWGQEFELYLSDNVLATQRLLEASRACPPRRFVFASSSSVYGAVERFPMMETDATAPVSPYGITKLAGEHLCRQYFRAFGVPTVVLRFFTIFGPRQRPDMAFSRFIRAGLAGDSLPVFGDARQERNFTYVADAVAATLAAGERGTPGSVYNVAGGSVAALADSIEILGRVLEVDLEVDHRPRAIGDPRRTDADTRKARLELGYRPRTSLEEGLRAQVEAELARAAPATRLPNIG